MRKTRHLRVWASGAVAILGIVTPVIVAASSANISKSYKASETISDGSIVSLDVGRTDYVAPANTDNAARLLGVVLDSDESLLAVNPSQAGEVQVATSGSVNAFVSTLNGDIQVGDAVSVSPFNGVGMKAAPGQRVIGLAQTDFNGDSSSAARQQVRNEEGESTSVAVGYVKLNIAIGTNNPSESEGALQRIARNLTGRTIPTVRLLMSAFIALIALIAIITLTYSSIHGSIVSVGRNPLARYAIFRVTGLMFILAFLIAGVAGVSIFFLLR